LLFDRNDQRKLIIFDDDWLRFDRDNQGMLLIYNDDFGGRWKRDLESLTHRITTEWLQP
jgi:hypothetical protein